MDGPDGQLAIPTRVKHTRQRVLHDSAPLRLAAAANAAVFLAASKFFRRASCWAAVFALPPLDCCSLVYIMRR